MFHIQTSTSNKFASMNENSSLLIKKNQSELIIENEMMQNDDYMILSTSFI